MSVTTSANIRCSLSFTQIDQQNLARINDIGGVNANMDIGEGTGIGEANCLFHAIGVLPSGGSTKFDLTSLTRTLFEEDVLIAFNNIKGFLVRNTSDVQGEYFHVAATGTNAWTDPFFGGSGNVMVNPRGGFPLSHGFEGWSISGTNKNIYLIDSGAGVSYEIAIFGVSG